MQLVGTIDEKNGLHGSSVPINDMTDDSDTKTVKSLRPPDSRVPNAPTKTRLYYLADLPIYSYSKPVQVVPGFADHENVSNVKLEPGPEETINDVRGQEHRFTLERNGFQYAYYPSKVADFASKEALENDYLKECERLLRRVVPGVDEVVFFDARLRKSQDTGTRGQDGLSTNPFARQVHVDELETSITTRIRSQTELKADFLLRGRVRVINIWRPVGHRVHDCALALTDTVRSNLTTRDVIECDRVRRDTGRYWDSMGVIQYRPCYSWWYMSNQSPEEPVLFMGYDSDCTKRVARQEDVDGNPGFCLHTAFDVPGPYPDGWRPRESIEVRALVFTYPDLGMSLPLRNSLSDGSQPQRTRSFNYDANYQESYYPFDHNARDGRHGSQSRRDSAMVRDQEKEKLEEHDEDVETLRDELASLRSALRKEKEAREAAEAQLKILQGDQIV